MSKLKKIILPFVGLPLATAFVSCGTIVDTGVKAEQDKKLASQETTKFVQNAYIENILSHKFYPNGSLTLQQSFQDTNSAFFKASLAAFNFYQESEIAKNPTFSLELLSKLSENNALANTDLANLRTQAGWNKKFNTTGFITLYNNFSTGIREIVNKMLLVKGYLLNLNEQDITSSSSYKDAMSGSGLKETYESINPKNSDFFLLELMLTKQPAQVWKFESKDPIDITTLSQLRVRDVNSFNTFLRKGDATNNALLTKKEQAYENIGTNDKQVDTTKLFGYSGILYNQGSSTPLGDLDYSLNFLKSQGEVRSGFVDPKTNKIWSSAQIAAYSKINSTKVYPLTFSATFDKKKTNTQITTSDVSINQANYSVVKVYPSSNDNNRSATAVVKINLGTTNLYYSIDFNWDDKQINQSPEFPTTGTQLMNLTNGLPSVNDNLDQINIRFVNKITPLYQKDATSNKFYFSLANTPWASDASKEKLAYLFYLADQNGIYNSAKNFFESQGYTIDVKDSTVKLS